MKSARTHAPWALLLGVLIQSAHGADCNSNGVPDHVDLTVPVLRADLPVPFDAQQVWGPPLAEDLNGDGAADLVALEGISGGDDFAIWMNRSGGGFDAALRYPTGIPAKFATAADLDGDGSPDLATLAFISVILIAWNNGQGRFSEPLRVNTDDNYSSLAHGDVDGDGRADLITGYWRGAVVHLNHVSAPFETHRPVGPELWVRRIAVGDLDRDGDLDLALSISYSDSGDDIVLLSNRGDATFDVGGALQLAGTVVHPILEDLDADGDPDLAAAVVAGGEFDPPPPGDNRIAVFTNDGRGVFGPESALPLPSAPLYVAAADVDQDGDPDLFASAADFFLFRNEGGTFGGREMLEQSTSVGLFAVRDIDQRGPPEVWKAREDVAYSLGLMGLAVAPWSIDCDQDGIPDECGADCNRNRRADSCDVADGPDCNGNSIPDACDPDCNENSIPDDCDLAAGMGEDCNGNHIPDSCETADCNGNHLPDDCDVTAGRSQDCNGNLRPDECEGDCNSSGLPDDCDVARGTSPDANRNGIPDECEAVPGFLYDFEQANSALVSPGGKARLEVRSRLHIIGLAPGVMGTQGWGLFALTKGCVPVVATLAGTVAAKVTDDPPGQVNGGFQLIRLVLPAELEVLHQPYDGGYTSAVVLSFQVPVSLDPAGSPYVIARATLEGLAPPEGCAECLLHYPEHRFGDGSGGTGGFPADNVVTFRGETQYPRREGMTVRFCQPLFHRGDANGDGRGDVSDAVTIFAFLFLGGPAPGCREAANADDSPVIDISDGIFLLTFLYLGGAIPPPPGAPSRSPCGPDPGGPQGDLGCEQYDGCG